VLPINNSSSPFRFKVKAQPNASKNEIVGMLGESLKVRVKAPPENGKANEAIENLLAKTLGIKKTQINVISGLSQSQKIIEVHGLTDTEIKTLLKL
jgi:uncharacterized protein (TIGR00251 family)